MPDTNVIQLNKPENLLNDLLKQGAQEQPALETLLGKGAKGLSPNTVSRLKQQWEQDGGVTGRPRNGCI